MCSNHLWLLTLATSELVNSLGAFRDSVACEFTREDKADCGLDFAARKGCLLVDTDEAGCFVCNLFKGIVDERVHGLHSALGDTDFRVDLAEDTEDVGGVGFLAFLLRFFLSPDAGTFGAFAGALDATDF
jgi:hypothetical protein